MKSTSTTSSLQGKAQPEMYSSRLGDLYEASVAAEYDEILIARVGGLLLDGQPGAKLLLNVDAGSGRLLVRLAKALEDRQMKFIGTDLFRDRVDAARKNVSRARMSRRIMVLQEDVHRLSFPDSFADVVVSRSTMHRWMDPAQALREIYRVLKPGGSAIIHDLRRDPPAEVVAAFQLKRTEAGIPAVDFQQKFAVGQVEKILAETSLTRFSVLAAPIAGAAALGFELFIQKPGQAAHPFKEKAK